MLTSEGINFFMNFQFLKGILKYTILFNNNLVLLLLIYKSNSLYTLYVSPTFKTLV